MDFSLSEEQIAIRDMARDFADEKLAPHALEWDAKAHFPKDVMREAASLGFATIYVPENQGGSGLTRLDAASIFEELSTGCVSTAAYLSIHNMVAWMISAFGDEAQRNEWLPVLGDMRAFSSYCLTEPGSGSDAAAMKTNARLEGGDYVLNGGKAFISGAGASDLYLVMAREGDGVSSFLVPSDAPGLSFGQQEQKMGWSSQPTAQVLFDECRIPARNRLGGEGQGFKFAMRGLDGGRINIGACSLGGARKAMRMAGDYALERKQFGQRLADFQATQFKLADMAADFTAARLMIQRAASLLDAGDPNASYACAQAKRFATDAGWRIADEALQIHGGYGFIHATGVERILRDLRVHRILEGTNEIMRVVASRRILRDIEHGCFEDLL